MGKIPRCFRFKIKSWLLAAGYAYCGVSTHEGGRVIPPGAMTSRSRRCKKCGVEHQLAMIRNSPEFRKYKAAYRKKHPEYNSNWEKRNPDKRPAYRRAHYARIREDPAAMEKKREYERNYYRSRKNQVKT